jgi:hypothetical protein
MPHELSILQNFIPALVRAEPFPHFVIEGALPAAIYERLSAEYPADEIIFANVDRKRPESRMRSNTRYDLSAARVHANPALDIGLWREFVCYHTSQDFLDEVIDKLGDVIAIRHPHLLGMMRSKAPGGRPRAGVRRHDDHAARCELALDCQVGINSKVTGPASTVKSLHLDNSVELFAGLFYLRLSEDRSTGGDLEIYRRRPGAPILFFDHRFVRPEHAEIVETVSYGPNKFAWLLNDLDAIHGVSVRGQTDFPRRLVNIIAEVYPTVDRLFDERPYAERKSVFERLRSAFSA